MNSARSAEKAKKKTSQVRSGEKRRRLDGELADAADNDDNNNYLDDLLDDDETPILEQDWSDHPNYSKILHKAVTACQATTLSPSKREGAPKCLAQMATDLQITDLPKAKEDAVLTIARALTIRKLRSEPGGSEDRPKYADLTDAA